jgi:hypothetical protein
VPNSLKYRQEIISSSVKSTHLGKRFGNKLILSMEKNKGYSTVVTQMLLGSMCTLSFPISSEALPHVTRADLSLMFYALGPLGSKIRVT